MRDRRPSLSLAVTVAALTAAVTIVAGCAAPPAVTPGPAAPPSATPSAGPRAAAAYPWSEARAHMGQTATFTGPVAATIYEKGIDGHPTFLNLGVDYPDTSRLTVIIWEKDRAAFPAAPEKAYAGKTVRVTGTVIEYQKAPGIAITSPDAIDVVD